LFFAYGYAGFMVLVFLLFAPVLVRVFSSDPAVLPLAEVMLRMAAIYTLADANQVVFSGSLRGAGDAKWVMILATCVNWSLAINAFVLIKVFRIDPVLMWSVFVLHVVMLGVVMFLRFRTGRWTRMSLIDPRESIAN
jgi:MATE family multidrug resistance protein